ncbi:hypothetical protein B0T14DRAFT_207879 [Immersiella caudata]|uniref:Uncharacterized protein n=1 Tax=Immersiella caudata TaxID=314043 RepID=A0AA40BZN1_9PEZI|nr:hypothetical protein B0T14DRAFT_207879 [Immersiella caudata]
MSFANTNIAPLAQLLSDLFDRVQKGPQEFRSLTEDILQASTCISQIQKSQAAFHARVSKLGEVDRGTTYAVFRNIRIELEDLQREMNDYSERNPGARVFDAPLVGCLRTLCEKLQFRVRMLAMLHQSFVLAGGTKMAEALQQIRGTTFDPQSIDTTEAMAARQIQQTSALTGGLATTGELEIPIEAVPATAEQGGGDSLPKQTGNANNPNDSSDIAVEAGDPAKVRDRPLAKAFLWQYMLWNIRRRTHGKTLSMVLGLNLPMVITLGSVFVAPVLIWATIVDEHGLRVPT